MKTSEVERLIDEAKTRDDAAKAYALALRHPFGVSWVALNRVILRRWSMAGLKYVKALAWKLAKADGPIEDNGVHLA